MNEFLFGHLQFATVYTDDFQVFSNTTKEHKHLLTVIQMLLENCVILNPKKIEFQKKIDFLGKRIKNEQIKVQHIHTKIRKVLNTFKTQCIRPRTIAGSEKIDNVHNFSPALQRGYFQTRT